MSKQIASSKQKVLDSFERVPWSKMEQEQALKEGWGIFYVPDLQQYQLQRYDEGEIFQNDGDAWKFVVSKIEAGSFFHEKALNCVSDKEKELIYETLKPKDDDKEPSINFVRAMLENTRYGSSSVSTTEKSSS